MYQVVFYSVVLYLVQHNCGLGCVFASAAMCLCLFIFFLHSTRQAVSGRSPCRSLQSGLQCHCPLSQVNRFLKWKHGLRSISGNSYAGEVPICPSTGRGHGRAITGERVIHLWNHSQKVDCWNTSWDGSSHSTTKCKLYRCQSLSRIGKFRSLYTGDIQK